MLFDFVQAADHIFLPFSLKRRKVRKAILYLSYQMKRIRITQLFEIPESTNEEDKKERAVVL